MADRLRMAPARLVTAASGRLAQSDIGRSGKRAAPFYLSADWKSFRNQLFKERGWRCEDQKCKTPHGPWRQIYGDHIVEIVDGGSKFERANIMLRCGACHARKTRDEKAKRAGWIDVAAVTKTMPGRG